MKQIILAGFCIAFLAVSAQQPAQTSKQRGAALYKQYCLTCHQATEAEFQIKSASYKNFLG
jgi:mono/diheme cytochrome c family protein